MNCPFFFWGGGGVVPGDTICNITQFKFCLNLHICIDGSPRIGMGDPTTRLGWSVWRPRILIFQKHCYTSIQSDGFEDPLGEWSSMMCIVSDHQRLLHCYTTFEEWPLEIRSVQKWLLRLMPGSMPGLPKGHLSRIYRYRKLTTDIGKSITDIGK